MPPGVVIPPSTVADGPTLRALAAALEGVGPGPYAVRSSANVEDGPLRSYAGQFETILGVQAADLAEAIQRVRGSASALRSLAYAGADLGPIAVIVQQLVPADCAGVAFTADPDTGERDVVRIEAVQGLGDRLVSGEADPETWVVRDEQTERTRSGPTPVLDVAQAAQLAALCRQVEVAFGFPVDVEWALSGGSFSLLQARPITALPAAPVPIALEVPEGDWDRDDHHAVISPLGWAWIQPYATGMTRMMNELGVPITEMRFARIGGRLYIRMVSPGGDAVPPRWVLWLVSRLLPSLRKANRLASHLLDDAGFLLAQKRWENETRPQFQAERARLDLADPSTLDDDALLARIQAAMDLCAKGLILHSELHTPGFAGLGRLALFLSDELQWPMDRAFDLVAGASPATTQKNADLRTLLQAHHDELEGRGLPRTWSALQRDCPRLGAALSAWLRDNRLHMQQHDPANPTLGERPELLLAVLEGLRAEDGNRSAGTGTADAVAKEALAALPAERREAFLQVLVDARAVAGLRDENGIELVSLPAGLLRHFVLELGRRLPGLDEPSHVTYLYPEEHGPALRGQIADLAERITRRRGEESWARRQRLPRRYGKPKPPMPDLSAFPEPMARLLRIFDWVDRAETLPEPSEDGDALRGVGVGTGLVVGRVRVLRGPDELSLLRRGEIAVCRITSPEWALGLDRMAGPITDEGGSLSHPAIIARELAIPAVLGTELATSRLRTGDRVELDAVSGTVRLLAGSRVDGGGTGASAAHRESRQSTT